MPENNEKAYTHFKKTREHRGLTISDVANALHLNITVIEQIEAGDFSSRRFAPVFMRGYIRSYAKYLALSDDIVNDLINMLDITHPLPMSTQKLPIPLKKQPQARRIKKIIAYIGVVIALIGLAFFWHNLHKSTAKTAENTSNISSTTPANPLPTDEIKSIASSEATQPLTQDTPSLTEHTSLPSPEESTLPAQSSTPSSNDQTPPLAENSLAQLPASVEESPIKTQPLEVASVTPPALESTQELTTPTASSTPIPAATVAKKSPPPSTVTSTPPEVIDAQETP